MVFVIVPSVKIQDWLLMVNVPLTFVFFRVSSPCAIGNLKNLFDKPLSSSSQYKVLKVSTLGLGGTLTDIFLYYTIIKISNFMRLLLKQLYMLLH